MDTGRDSAAHKCSNMNNSENILKKNKHASCTAAWTRTNELYNSTSNFFCSKLCISHSTSRLGTDLCSKRPRILPRTIWTHHTLSTSMVAQKLSPTWWNKYITLAYRNTSNSNWTPIFEPLLQIWDPFQISPPKPSKVEPNRRLVGVAHVAAHCTQL